MKQFVVALAVTFMAVGAANAASCSAQAKDKKLAGAAEKSFVTKCQSDAKSSCDKQAMDKKLAGAAKDSFTKKCIADAA
jgi:hypothetical protein